MTEEQPHLMSLSVERKGSYRYVPEHGDSSTIVAVTRSYEITVQWELAGAPSAAFDARRLGGVAKQFARLKADGVFAQPGVTIPSGTLHHPSPGVEGTAAELLNFATVILFDALPEGWNLSVTIREFTDETVTTCTYNKA